MMRKRSDVVLMLVGLEESVSESPPPLPLVVVVELLLLFAAVESAVDLRDRVIMVVVVGWCRFAMVLAIVHQR